MSDTQKRIREFIEYLGINVKSFEKQIGVSNGFVNSLGQNIQQRNQNKISKAFPKLNMFWLLTGEGNMLKSNISNDSPSINSFKKGVPYYDVDFIAGFDVMENSQIINPTYYIDFLPFNDADCWLNVTGKSMGPLIAHGDIVALKEVQDWKTFLLEGEIYAIITKNGFRTIKILGKDVEDSNNYLLIPYNKSGDYHPQPIPKNVITKIYRVKGAIKKFF